MHRRPREAPPREGAGVSRCPVSPHAGQRQSPDGVVDPESPAPHTAPSAPQREAFAATGASPAVLGRPCHRPGGPGGLTAFSKVLCQEKAEQELESGVGEGPPPLLLSLGRGPGVTFLHLCFCAGRSPRWARTAVSTVLAGGGPGPGVFPGVFPVQPSDRCFSGLAPGSSETSVIKFINQSA